MRTRFLLVILLLPALVVAGDLTLVTTVPYNSLREEIPSLAAGVDYGDRGVELWANIEADCFNTRQDVIDLFGQWLALWYPGHGLPGVLEMRCQPAGNDTSVGVIAETNVHGNAAVELHVFLASPNGGKVLRQLFDLRPGGPPMVVGPFLDFVLGRGEAVGVLYCDRSLRYEDGSVCRVFPVFNGAKESAFFATTLYQVNGPGEQRFLAITSTYEGECAIKKIGAQVTTLETLMAKPDRIADDLVGSKAAEKLGEAQSFLSKFEALVKNEHAVKVFDSSCIERYVRTLEQRKRMDATSLGGGSSGNE